MQRLVFALLSAYLLCACFRAINIHVEVGNWGSVYLPLMGYDCLCTLPGGLFYPWYWPNLLFIIGILFLAMRRWAVAGLCGVVAAVIASTVTVLVPMFYFGEFVDGHRLEAGFRFPLRIGYFVWLGCMIGLTYSARQLKLQALQLGRKGKP